MPEREVFWPKIKQYGATIQQPWLLTGDFNETVSLEDRNHDGIEMLRWCEKFKHWIDNNGFIDMGFSGHKFTWIKENNASIQTCVRLDRALCNVEW